MSENRSSENDLGGPGRWQWGAGTVSRRGLRRRQWQEGALKSEPGQIGKGQHPAHGTQRRGPGGSGFHTGSAGQSAPAPSPPERDFRFRICPSLEPLTCEWLFHLENRSDPKSRRPRLSRTPVLAPLAPALTPAQSTCVVGSASRRSTDCFLCRNTAGPIPESRVFLPYEHKGETETPRASRDFKRAICPKLV